MTVYLLTAAANLVVGGLVGLCGVAGFLLPIFYTSVLGMNVSEGLALSFAAFIVSGVLGSWNYKKAGNLNQRTFHVRLINLCTSDEKSSRKPGHKEFPGVLWMWVLGKTFRIILL